VYEGEAVPLSNFPEYSFQITATKQIDARGLHGNYMRYAQHGYTGQRNALGITHYCGEKHPTRVTKMRGVEFVVTRRIQPFRHASRRRGGGEIFISYGEVSFYFNLLIYFIRLFCNFLCLYHNTLFVIQDYNQFLHEQGFHRTTDCPYALKLSTYGRDPTKAQKEEANKLCSFKVANLKHDEHGRHAPRFEEMDPLMADIQAQTARL